MTTARVQHGDGGLRAGLAQKTPRFRAFALLTVTAALLPGGLIAAAPPLFTPSPARQSRQATSLSQLQPEISMATENRILPLRTHRTAP